MKNKSIIYINFSPYENAGNILDYLVDNFHTVIQFTFGFHNLSKHAVTDVITIYRNKKCIKRYHLIHAPVLSTFTFFLLPIRAFLIFSQLLYWSFLFKNVYKQIDIFFSVNAFTAWCGNLLRKFGIVKKTIFWVWDYYPPVHGSKIVELMRWLYWQFDKPASIESDSLIFLNKRLEMLRRNMNILPKDKEYRSLGIGTDPIEKTEIKTLKPLKLIFLGVIKKSQGIDLVLDTLSTMKTSTPIEFHIIGGGPDIEYFKKKSLELPHRVIFHGYVQDEPKVTQLIKNCHIGIATYVPDPSNVSYYSDPSKIKRYISLGVPVITTDVFSFSKELSDSQAGILTPYGKKYFEAAISTITKNYLMYQRNALQLSKKYYYRILYRQLFT